MQNITDIWRQCFVHHIFKQLVGIRQTQNNKNNIKVTFICRNGKGNKRIIANGLSGAEFVPWYEYEETGKPFHFKIVTDTSPTEELVKRFADILKYVKPQRSIIDGMETRTHIFDLQSFISTGEWHSERLEEI